MKIEILFPELCSLYGEHGNIEYIKRTFPQAKIYETSWNEEMRFINENINFLFMGPMTEQTQYKLIERFKNIESSFKRKVEEGMYVLFTGNASDILASEIIYSSTKRVDGLAYYNAKVVHNFNYRFNSIVLGEFKGQAIMGHKTQFTQTFGDNSNSYFFEVKKGTGINKDSNLEGFHYKNLYATNMVGPILLLNPYFTKYLFEEMTGTSLKLPYFDTLIEAYESRLHDFNSVKKEIY